MTTPQVTNVFSSKSDVAYHELRRMILSGELPAGSRLAQYVLAEKLQMSITPLREAIRRLSSEDLIELDNHKDARVATISAPEARQLFEVRLALDPAAVELAAQRRTDDDIASCALPSRGSYRSPANGAKTRSSRTASSTAPSTWPPTTTCSSSCSTICGTNPTATAAS